MKTYPTAYDFKDLKAPEGFVNLNEIFDLSNVDWLSPVQSLFGDWNGKYLILGQDLDGLDNIKHLKVNELAHNPNFETNKNLLKVFSANAPALYTNYFWFIKEGQASSSFSTRKEVVSANEPVFRRTIESMPNLETVVVLGSLTFRKVFQRKYRPLESHNKSLYGKNLRIQSIPHLGGLGMVHFCSKSKLSKPDALKAISRSIVSSHKTSFEDKK